MGLLAWCAAVPGQYLQRNTGKTATPACQMAGLFAIHNSMATLVIAYRTKTIAMSVIRTQCFLVPLPFSAQAHTWRTVHGTSLTPGESFMPIFSFSLRRVAHVLTLCVACLALLAGCNAPNKHYNDDEVRQADGVFFGTVANVSTVKVTQDPDALGPLMGGVAGGVVGAVVGGSTGAIVGAGAGILATGGAEMASKTYDATEITVELENGRYLVIVIGGADYFIRGDEVRIIGMGKQYVRVQHK